MVYVTLLSNDCLQEFPENHPSSFKNRLDAPLNLGPYHEMALCEMSYINSIDSSDDKPLQGCIKIFDFLATKDGGSTFGHWAEETLKKSCFSNAKELITCLNEAVWRGCTRLRDTKREIFSFDRSQERIWVDFSDKDDYVTILIEGGYLVLLGIEDKSTPSQLVVLGKDKAADSYTYNGEKRVFAEDCREAFKSVCTKRNFFSHLPKTLHFGELLVYCDCIQPLYCGGGRNRILRFVQGPDNADPGQFILRTYSGDRIYVPIEGSGYLREIGISIGLTNGEIFPISKPTRFTIHIREIAKS